MADKLYRSYSLEKSQNSTSGSITVWEDSPVSPLDIGDTFQPVQGSPSLTVDKVSIKDNVIGEVNGRPVRQWEITIEGSNGTQGSSQATHLTYSPRLKAGDSGINKPCALASVLQVLLLWLMPQPCFYSHFIIFMINASITA